MNRQRDSRKICRLSQRIQGGARVGVQPTISMRHCHAIRKYPAFVGRSMGWDADSVRLDS